jgi:hypothetical protein
MQCVEQAVTDVCAGCVEDAETRTKANTEKHKNTTLTYTRHKNTTLMYTRKHTLTHTAHTPARTHTHCTHNTGRNGCRRACPQFNRLKP